MRVMVGGLAEVTETDKSEPGTSADLELMRRTAEGDQQAFGKIVTRHQGPLVNFFSRMDVSTDAEDLAQETFVRLYRYRDRYRPTAKFTTFLYLLARQVRIDAIRKRVRREDMAKDLREDQEIRELPSPRRDEAVLKVADAVQQLDEASRLVVVMSVYQGLKYREIAEVLGVPEGTVKSRMFTALRRLKGLLREEDATDG